MIKTQLCELLGIEYPIIQGGMAWVADASLASAVSNAGGLGLIAAMNKDAEWLRKEIRKAKQMTNKLFGVNVMLKSRYADEVAKVIIEEGVKVVTTGAGSPAKYMDAWLKAGIKVIPVIPSTGTAKMVERYGACAVVAEGGESGGHVGELTTMVLVPQVCDAVNIPVIAAGGIADGRGIAAALMLGAVGVQCGTAFLVAEECNIHRNYKDKVLKARDIDTVTFGKRLGHPIRAIRTQFSRELAKMEYDSAIPNEELEALGVGSLQAAAQQGNEETGCFMAGQIAAMIQEEKPAEMIIKDMFKQAEEILSGASKWVK